MRPTPPLLACARPSQNSQVAERLPVPGDAVREIVESAAAKTTLWANNGTRIIGAASQDAFAALLEARKHAGDVLIGSVIPCQTPDGRVVNLHVAVAYAQGGGPLTVYDVMNQPSWWLRAYDHWVAAFFGFPLAVARAPLSSAQLEHMLTPGVLALSNEVPSSEQQSSRCEWECGRRMRSAS